MENSNFIIGFKFVLNLIGFLLGYDGSIISDPGFRVHDPDLIILESGSNAGSMAKSNIFIKCIK